MKHLLTAALAVFSLAAGTSAQAATCYTAASLPAAKLRHLDVMLMVSSLRCRTGADDFQADYEHFVDHNRGALSAANHAMLDDYAARLGAAKASAEMDRLSVSMANHYGQGTGIGCHELRMVAHDLAETVQPAALSDAAEALVGQAALENACGAEIAQR